MKKFYLIIPFLFILIALTSAQTLSRSTLGCLGGTLFSGDGVTIKQTVGQPANTEIFQNNGIILRQGFQQALPSGKKIDVDNSFDFTLYPNPAFDKTMIYLSEKLLDFSISIYNMTGLCVKKIDNQRLVVTEVDLSGIQPGLYIVTLKSDARTSSKRLVINY